jgi:hypothetical protein
MVRTDCAAANTVPVAVNVPGFFEENALLRLGAFPKSKFEICKLTRFRYETEGVAVEPSVSQTTSALGSVSQFALMVAAVDVGAGVGLGAVVGATVGVALGAIVGDDVGARVGLALGLAAGGSEGTGVDGLAVGVAVGVAVADAAFATIGATGADDVPLHAARAMLAT